MKITGEIQSLIGPTPLDPPPFCVFWNRELLSTARRQWRLPVCGEHRRQLHGRIVCQRPDRVGGVGKCV